MGSILPIATLTILPTPAIADVVNTLTTTQSALKHTLEKQSDTLATLFGQQAVDDTQSLYQSLKFQPLWQDSLFNNPAENIIDVLQTAGQDGLRASHYHIDTLKETLKDADTLKSLQAKVTKDLLFSAALMRYLQDINYGQTNTPAYTNQAVKTARPEGHLQALFLKTINSRNAQEAARTAKIQTPTYKALQQALLRYNAKAQNGGWPTIPPIQKVLTVGDQNSKIVPLIIKRLEAESYLTPQPPTSVYTQKIATAVKQFQQNYSLKPDGIFGSSTRQAMNLSALNRAEQIMLSMERYRWLPDDLGETHIQVNIPAFTLNVMEKGSSAFKMPVIVGSPKHQTPTMHTLATDITFNPYWYIPHSILSEELLAKLTENPELFYLRNYEASYGSYTAEAVYNIFDILASAEEQGERLRFRQRPGRYNPLGRARIGIKNNDAIYLHDTPEKALFSRENRALSHGCIRLSDPKKLVTYLLNKAPEWSTTQINAQFSLKNPENPNIANLETPVPVHLVYHTAWVEEGTVKFAPDIYNRDASLKLALWKTQTDTLPRLALR